MAPSRIYLVGTTGHPNYGDELIGASWLRYLARTSPDAEVWLDSPSPGGSELLLGHLHPNVRFVDTVFQLAWAAPSEEPWVVADFVGNATRHPGVVPRRAAGVDLLHGVDVFHILGGGYLNAIWPRHVGILAAGDVLAREFQARSALTGAGLTPSAASGALLSRLTTSYSVLDVRDDNSAKLLGERATSSGDDSFLDLGQHLYDKRDSRPVMMTLQADLADIGISAVAEAALECLQSWGVSGEDVGYVEAMPGSDRHVFNLLDPLLPGMRFYPFTEVWREGLPARAGQRWLTTRLHMHLLAAAVGAEGAVIPVEADAYDATHGALITGGSGWTAVRPGEPTPLPGSDVGFGPRAAERRGDKRAVAAAIYRQ